MERGAAKREPWRWASKLTMPSCPWNPLHGKIKILLTVFRGWRKENRHDSFKGVLVGEPFQGNRCRDSLPETGSLGPPCLRQKESYSQSSVQHIPTSDKAVMLAPSPAVYSLTGRLKSRAGTDVKIKCRQTSSDNTLFLEPGIMVSMYMRVKKITWFLLNQNRLTCETGFAVLSIYNLFCHIYISGCELQPLISDPFFRGRAGDITMRRGEESKHFDAFIYPTSVQLLNIQSAA